MLYLAYHPKTRPTGRKLADALGIRHRGTLVRKRQMVNPFPDFLIRWGNARYGDQDAPERCINPAKAIWRSGDKLAAFRKFSDKGVLRPEFSTACPGDGVIFARSRRGFGGRDIQVCNHSPCVRAELYVRYIPNEREYRLHVVGDRVVRVQRKYLERPELRRSEYIKNVGNGYVFKMPQKRLNHDREEAAIAAVKALGLDFGAVDLVIGSDDKKAYVLEVNSAPACSPKTMNAYVQAIAQLVRERSNDDYILHPSVDVEAQLGDDE